VLPKQEGCKPVDAVPPGAEWRVCGVDFFPRDVGFRLTDRYGERIIRGQKEWHNGLDIAPGWKESAGFGTAVLAPCSGIIAGYRMGGTPEGKADRVIFYAHGQPEPWLNLLHVELHEEIKGILGDARDSANVKVAVPKGHAIGRVNNTGRVTGAHIHLMLSAGGFWWNPETRLDG